jgi:Tol biopolymer transport system component
MAPEQVRGKPADQRSDMFAFGAILHEMLTGRRAFHGDSAADTMSAILKEDPPELSAINPRVPPGLERIVRHCLEKSPGERFHSAHDLAFQLEAISDQSGSVAGAAAALHPSVSWRSVAVAATLLAAGALVGAALAQRFTRAPLPDAPTLRYLTFSGDDWGPTASPDGRLIAFCSDRDGQQRVWLKDLAGGNEVPLTSGPDVAAAFAPDGSTIYFQRSVGERYDLYRVPVVGGEPRKLLEDVSYADPAPDGRSLAFLRETKDRWQVWITSADGSGERLLTTLPTDRDATELRWSPDGGRLAAVLQDTGASILPGGFTLIDADSGAQRALAPAHPRRLLGRLCWEPSGQALLYTQVEMTSYADVSGTSRLIRQDIDSGEARTLVSFPRTLASSGMALLGPGRLVLDADASRQNLQEEAITPRPASAGRFLTRGSTVDRQPAYSPDGERIVFTGMRGDNYELWEMSRKTGSLRRLTDHPAHDWDPAYTPDGTKLLWSSNRTGNFEIWTAAADGSGPRQLSRDGVDAENPTATPDGSWVVYSSANSAQPGLWKIRSDGSQATRIVEGNAIHPEVSPDGRHVLWFSETPGKGRALHVHGVADGRPAGFEIKGLSDWRGRWLPDGKRIAFVHREGRAVRGLFAQDFSPGRDTRSTRRPLGGFHPGLEAESFGISPDGSRVTVSQIEYGSALLLIDGLAGLPGRRAGPE